MILITHIAVAVFWWSLGHCCSSCCNVSQFFTHMVRLRPEDQGVKYFIVVTLALMLHYDQIVTKYVVILIPFIPCSLYKSNVQGFPTTFIHLY
jgi:hypothetical protein